MLIAVSARGRDLDAEVDPRFGRAAYILMVDSRDLSFEVLDNAENSKALKGAGIQAAAMIAKKGAAALITGHCGPNAFKVLEKAGIAVANNGEGTVRQAVSAYLEGRLPTAAGPDVEGQW